MPRVADPQLEGRLLAETMRLADEHGIEAVTMRSVASAAGVTTGAIYERFADREALLQRVIALAQKELVAAFRSLRTVEEFAKAFIGYFSRYPHRFEVSLRLFDARLASGEPMPLYEILKALVVREAAVNGRTHEHLALAIISLMFGTIRSMIAVGPDTSRGRQLRRSSLTTLRLLLSSFPRK